MRNIRSLAYCAICIALITVCAWVAIPFAVPFTLQTFAVFLSAAILGPRRVAAAVSAYILLGICGAPVFSGFSAGLQAIIGPTGGYLTGFIPAAAIAGSIAKGASLPRRIAGMCAGLMVCYVFGTAWFMRIYSGGTSLLPALSACVFPFIIPDIIKIILAAVISERLDKTLQDVR
ncbi:MAG: biotin transporter BioY [Clostridia bacterium]|nr:biotin transporter BioY [Clostridia bacterium]